MKIDTAKLKNVSRKNNGVIIAQCPACAAEGKDEKGDHFFLRESGVFGCVAHQGLPGREHRSVIFSMIGIFDEKKFNNAQIFPNIRAAAESYIPPDHWLLDITEYKSGGEDYAAVARYDTFGGKIMAQMSKVSGGWKRRGPQGEWPLMRESEILSEGIVHVFEGEMKTKLAAQKGMNATTSAGGCGAAGNTDWTLLAGRDVIIWPDADEGGYAYAEDVSKILLALSPPARVKIIKLPFEFKSGKDIGDYFTAGRTMEDVQRLIDNSGPWIQAPQVIQPPGPPQQEAFFYDKYRKEYVRKNSRGAWLSLNETQFKQELAAKGLNRRAEKGQNVSEIEGKLIEIRDKHDIDYAGPLAGYEEGFYHINGNRILVTRSAEIVKPEQGSFGILDAFISQLLMDGEHDQYSHFVGWLKIAYESLAAHQFRPGQAIALCGERDSGKSLLQKIITIILGGRIAKPYAYMTQRTDFNADLFEAEHLCIEDEQSTTDIRSRRAFGAALKQITACENMQCHAKHKQAITLTPFWRLSVSLNDEPENLMVLPPIDDSIADKIMLFRVKRGPMPMPTTTNDQRAIFWKQLVSEVPAFIYHLVNNWQVQPELKNERYGIKEFHHPYLMRELDALAPEFKLFGFIKKIIFSNQMLQWEGTSTDLEHALLANGDYRSEINKLLSWNNACGTYLGRLAIKYPQAFSYARTNSERHWTINPSYFDALPQS